VTGSGVGFRLTPTVPDDARILCGAEDFVAGVDVSCARIGVMRVEEDVRVVGAGGRDSGIVTCLALGLEGREISFVWEREEEAPVERKRPSSSSKGAGGMIDLPVVSGDLAGCESKPKWFLRDLVEDVDERRNKSSGSMGWASRSESPSKSESGGTNDFLRRGDGVSAGELYLRKWREEGIEGDVCWWWWWWWWCRLISYINPKT
jgi:hypothetical protein